MKNLITLLIITALCTNLISCESSDDNGTRSYISPIEGRWNLTNVSGGFIGINQNYKPGEIIWDFNAKDSKVIVTNDSKVTQEKNYNGLESGKYSYSVFTEKKIEYISIEGSEYGLLKTDRGILVINQNYRSTGTQADFYVLTFSK
jgi:hypothetical protein